MSPARMRGLDRRDARIARARCAVAYMRGATGCASLRRRAVVTPKRVVGFKAESAISRPVRPSVARCHVVMALSHMLRQYLVQ